jgi:hypothetical protein
MPCYDLPQRWTWRKRAERLLKGALKCLWGSQWDGLSALTPQKYARRFHGMVGIKLLGLPQDEVEREWWHHVELRAPSRDQRDQRAYRESPVPQGSGFQSPASVGPGCPMRESSSLVNIAGMQSSVSAMQCQSSFSAVHSYLPGILRTRAPLLRLLLRLLLLRLLLLRLLLLSTSPIWQVLVARLVAPARLVHALVLLGHALDIRAAGVAAAVVAAAAVPARGRAAAAALLDVNLPQCTAATRVSAPPTPPSHASPSAASCGTRPAVVLEDAHSSFVAMRRETS